MSQRSRVLLAVLASLALARCGSPRQDCPSSQELVDGRCVDRVDDAGRPVRPGRDGGNTDEDGSGADVDGPAPDVADVATDPADDRGDTAEVPDASPDSAGGVCAPGARRCRGNEVFACDADGASESSVATCPSGCIAGACVEGACASDGKQYLGCGFWAVYLDNEARGQGFGVAISNPNPVPVDVSVAGPTGVISTQRVPAGELAFVTIEDGVQIDNSSLSQSAYQIGSSGPVTVHQFNPPNNLRPGFSTDASLLLPATSLDTDYVVMAWHSGDDMGRFAGLSARSYVTIVAVSAGSTSVTFTSPAGLQAGAGVAATPPGGTQTVTLAQGDVLSLIATRNDGDDPEPDDPADLTGMRISATAPIAVFSGSEASYIPDDSGPADHIEQQLYPTSAWGTSYVVSKFSPRGTEDDLFRVMVRDGGTTLRTDPPIPDVDGRTLRNAGDAVQFAYNGSFRVWADTPISVGQFMVGSLYPGIPSCTRSNTSGCRIPVHPSCEGKRIGDPAFLLPAPTERYRRDYIVYVPEGFVQNFVSTTAPAGTAIVVDDVPTLAPAAAIGATGWEVRHIPLEPGVHRIVAEVPFGANVYGYGCDVSYAYPGGLDLAD
jgi:hypothetical protein